MKQVQVLLFGHWLFFVQLSVYGQIESQQIATRPLTMEEVREDFSILKGVLTTDYPSSDRYISKDSVHALWASWERQLRPMNEREFNLLVGEITHSFHDEHLIPNPSRRLLANPNRCFLPFTLNVDGDELWTSEVHALVRTLEPGDKILSINGHKADEIIREVSGKMHHDGMITTFIERHMEDFSPTQSFNYFDRWYGLIYEDSVRHFDLLVVRGLDTLELAVPSMLRKDYLDFYWSRMSRDAPANFKVFNDSVGYLEISSFHGWYRKKHDQKFEKFFYRTFKEIRERGINHLILDLRRCEGGDDSNKLLLRYLINQPFTVIKEMNVTFSGQPKYNDYYDNSSLKIEPKLVERIASNWYRLSALGREKIAGLKEVYPKKYVFQGKLMVLTSGATGSAAAVTTAILKTYSDAKFIGEETGGTMDGPTALIVPLLTLPHSQIRVEIPLVQIHLNAEGEHGRGVTPDMEFSPTKYPGKKLIEEVLHLF